MRMMVNKATKNCLIICTAFLSIENNTDYHSTNDVPFKKGKLSHEEDELSLGGRRPSRQASQVIN